MAHHHDTPARSTPYATPRDAPADAWADRRSPAPSSLTAFRAEVDDVVGLADGACVVLHHHKAVALLLQALQGTRQARMGDRTACVETPEGCRSYVVKHLSL